jgi:hypothetical protein
LPQPDQHKGAIIDAEKACIDMYNAWLALGGFSAGELRTIARSHLEESLVVKSFFTWAYCTDHGRHLVEYQYLRDYMARSVIVKVDGEVHSHQW